MLYFTLFMLMLALMAYFPPPASRRISPLWFFTSWFPCELPWFFGVFHAIVLAIFILLKCVSNNWFVTDVVVIIISLPIIGLWYCLHRKTFTAGPTFAKALGMFTKSDSVKIPDYLCIDKPRGIIRRDWLKPFSFQRPGVEVIYDVAYGAHPRQRLDIYRPALPLSASSENVPAKRPVLLHVHGGAWMVGHKKQQAQPLINYLTQQGWLCVDINYRLAPRERYPACLVDVKTAIVWLKNTIASYGGDPEFIVITGESAGGHLCALAALTANKPEFQPGFEACDTRVQAAVPLYGIYDFTNANQTRSGARLKNFLSRYVMPCAENVNPEYWRGASPLHQVNEQAPPMFVIQGSHDCLALVEDARQFVKKLQENTSAPLVYAELSGTQHAFEIFHGVRAEFTIEAISIFLYICHQQYLSSQNN